MAQATLPVELTDEVQDLRTKRPAWVRTLWEFARSYPYLIPALVFFLHYFSLPLHP